MEVAAVETPSGTGGEAVKSSNEGEKTNDVVGSTEQSKQEEATGDASKETAATTAPASTIDKPKQWESSQASTNPAPKKVTYGDAPFTDAGKSQPFGTVPVGGRWEGHFENVVPNFTVGRRRKDGKRDNRVREVFHIFFNSTPPEGARTVFVDNDPTSAANDMLNNDNDTDADSSKKDDNQFLLPKGRLHVRGYGTNRFGTFEIVGSYNPATEMLHCQRMYVETPPENEAPTAKASTRGRKKRSAGGQFASSKKERRSSTKDGEDGKKGPRKRKPSLKKRDMDSDGFGEYVPSMYQGVGDGSGVDIASVVKKRARMSNDSTASATPLPQCRGSDSVNSMKGPSATSSTKPVPSLRTALTSSGGKRSKKFNPAPKKGILVTSAPPSDVAPPLPTAGDPFLARWRAAHFIYYQRVEVNPEGDGQQGLSGGVTRVNSVVYEGEMYDGYREGRGICLFNNNTMYEGQWKRNKEHGKGTLMTPDRSRIIYDGDWERGRMHGYGSYYYYMDTLADGPHTGDKYGQYIGEFRESMRNGRGVYTFPDESSYEGEWRENIPNGWGIFRWPDQSVFEGFWKDGRRHGAQGTLIASDGFKYEGAWVNGAMEGRGIATIPKPLTVHSPQYPNGQVYEGMWVAGRREGRGTIRFTNGAVYEGRFKDDNMEGQGTMKMSRNVVVPLTDEKKSKVTDVDAKNDWMIPIEFQSDISHIHQKAGFTQVGL
eukprot:scaffold2112_cov172-Alexandrium_tamarense.AAC.2